GARGADVRLRLVAETLFCLLAGDAHDRYVTWTDADGTACRDILASRGEMPGNAPVGLTDEWLRFAAAVSATAGAASPPTAFWRDAIQTVSQREGGYERVYQGTVVAPVWDVAL